MPSADGGKLSALIAALVVLLAAGAPPF